MAIDFGLESLITSMKNGGDGVEIDNAEMLCFEEPVFDSAEDKMDIIFSLEGLLSLIGNSSKPEDLLPYISQDENLMLLLGTDSSKWKKILEDQLSVTNEGLIQDMLTSGLLGSWLAKRSVRLKRGLENGIKECAALGTAEVAAKTAYIRSFYLPDYDVANKKIKALEIMLKALQSASKSIMNYNPKTVVDALNALGISPKRMDEFNFNSLFFGSVMGLLVEKVVGKRGWNAETITSASKDLLALLNETDKSASALNEAIKTKYKQEAEANVEKQPELKAKMKHLKALASGYTKGLTSISRGLANVGFRLSSSKLSLQGALTTLQ